MTEAGSEISLVDNLRKARSRRAVIKMRFVTLRGRAGTIPILAFEGDDDKIVYSRWINRIRHGLKYEAFVCDGKRGVAQLKSMLDSDLGGLVLNTYFFVDRDFIDLNGFNAKIDESIYMTDSYSFENYLVSASVVDDLLRDEFPLHESPHIRQQVVDLFKMAYKQFLYITGEFNWHLYLARNLDIELAEKLPSRLSSYASVSLHAVKSVEILVSDQVKMLR